jgi:hypothetical protein
MDEKDFKKHLQDLVHGHHHPEEHDWSPDTDPQARENQGRSGVRKNCPEGRTTETGTQIVAIRSSWLKAARR